MKTRKEMVLELLKSIETGAKEPMAYVNAESYKQHNLQAKDGVEGFGEYLSQIANSPERATVNTVRIIEDGDYVAAHTEYNLFGHKVGFDIFRFEDNLIVEHWDNLTPNEMRKNPSGHTLTDGEMTITDRDKTEQNKQLVTRFVSDILIRRRMDDLDEFFNNGNYIQHEPSVADGVEPLKILLTEYAAGRPYVVLYNAIHKVIGEGNFVLTVSEGTVGEGVGEPASFYDLFRVENGYIAEHWCTVETIPNRAQWRNENGKFGFKERVAQVAM